jgi:hypothetical protein
LEDFLLLEWTAVPLACPFIVKDAMMKENAIMSCVYDGTRLSAMFNEEGEGIFTKFCLG